MQSWGIIRDHVAAGVGWDSRCRMGYQVTSLATRCARGSFYRTPEHGNMPLERTEGTQACSGVSIFDSRAHWMKQRKGLTENPERCATMLRTLVGTPEPLAGNQNVNRNAGTVGRKPERWSGRYSVNIWDGIWRGRQRRATVPFCTPSDCRASREH